MITRGKEGWQRGPEQEVYATLERTLADMQAASPFAVLGIADGADGAAVRAAFLIATKAYHPNRFARREPETRRLANEVFLMIRGAYGALKNTPLASAAEAEPEAEAVEESAPTKRAPAEKSGRRGGGRRTIADRRKALAGRRASSRRLSSIPSVAAAAERTRRLEEESAAAKALEEAVARAEAALGAGRFEEAREAYHALAVANPDETRFRAQMQYAAGRAHESDGSPSEARVAYRRALGIDPHFEEARSALAVLDGERRSGFFSKLFRK